MQLMRRTMMSKSTSPEDSTPENNKEAEKYIVGAVLLSDEITEYCRSQPPLIDPFDYSDTYLKPASYHLCIGDTIRINGEDKTLSDENPTTEIPPHGIAMIRTLEKIHLPHHLIGRWNIRATEVYNGLIWVGGPQVDPGYSGPLICPVFNLSTRPYVLKYRYPLFTIDFVRTTPFNAETCKEFKAKRQTDSIGALDQYRTKSALKDEFDKMKVGIKEHKEYVEAVQNRMWIIIGILFTALALIATFGLGSVRWYLSWIPFVIAIFALGFSIIAIWLVSKKRKRSD